MFLNAEIARARIQERIDNAERRAFIRQWRDSIPTNQKGQRARWRQRRPRAWSQPGDRTPIQA